MLYPLCRHIKTNGSRCQCPSLNGQVWCYFHDRLHQRHSPFRTTETTAGSPAPGHHIELTALEDPESVQVALSMVINALATGHLETKRATALLYGLQLAAMNTPRLQLKPYAPNVVRIIDSSPNGLDLASPGAFLEIGEEENQDDQEHDEDETEADDQNA